MDREPEKEPAPEDPTELQNRILENMEISRYNTSSHPNRSIKLFQGSCLQKMPFTNLFKIVETGAKQ